MDSYFENIIRRQSWRYRRNRKAKYIGVLMCREGDTLECAICNIRNRYYGYFHEGFPSPFTTFLAQACFYGFDLNSIQCWQKFSIKVGNAGFKTVRNSGSGRCLCLTAWCQLKLNSLKSTFSNIGLLTIVKDIFVQK